MGKEKELRSQISRLRQQFKIGRSSIQEHLEHTETLSEEILALMDKKADLEQQDGLLSVEMADLRKALETSSNKMRQLERKQTDQDHLIREREKDIEELRAGNHLLLERFETVSRSRSSSPNCQMSLFSELEMSCSDQEKSFRATTFDVIEETDEEFDIEERDDSDYEMICGVDKDLENFKKEVSHNDKGR